MQSESSADGDADAAFFTHALDEFPPVCAAFAYGSAIFSQRGHTAAYRATAMVDLVLVVDDATQWHAANLSGGNAMHYTGIGRWAGARAVAQAQERIGGKMYYNHAHVCGRPVKYGVIGREALLEDLQHWRSLYVSGRLHKPVRTLTPWPADVAPAVASNLRAALGVSLLLLPERFEGSELLRTIVGLSYGGDVRMGDGKEQK